MFPSVLFCFCDDLKEPDKKREGTVPTFSWRCSGGCRVKSRILRRKTSKLTITTARRPRIQSTKSLIHARMRVSVASSSENLISGSHVSARPLIACLTLKTFQRAANISSNCGANLAPALDPPWPLTDTIAWFSSIIYVRWIHIEVVEDSPQYR